MSPAGYDILESAIEHIWGRTDEEILNQIMIAFITGYATGTEQVYYKG